MATILPDIEKETQLRRILDDFDTISLDEMGKVKLMNRIDTKYVVSVAQLMSILSSMKDNYRIQVVESQEIASYRTVYFDTENAIMYLMHQNGRKTREKIRVRTYVDSALTFLEVKNKNNHGRTKKTRITVQSTETLAQDGADDFLSTNAWYRLSELSPRLENQFGRITLVDKNLTERLTIDLGISFINKKNGRKASLPEIAVVELKREGLKPSFALDVLKNNRIQKASFSKYCMGCALTDDTLKQNLFKPKIRNIHKVLNMNIINI